MICMRKIAAGQWAPLAVAAAMVIGPALALGGQRAYGATADPAQDSISFTQSGTNTDVKLTLKSPSGKKLQAVTVAVRDSRNNNLDYPNATNVSISKGGSYTFSGSKHFNDGTYTMFGAYKINGSWTNFTKYTVRTPVGPGDTTPPSTPTGLTVGTVTSSSVALSWTASTDNVGVKGYNVFRDGVNVASNFSGTSYTDSGLAASTTHSYTVQATDQAGNASAQSNAVQATTSAGTPPPTTPADPPSTPPPTTPANPSPNGPTGNWSLKFNDEFNGNSVDTSKWSFKSSAEGDQSNNPLGTGNLSNQQLEFDQPGNCAVKDGALTITAKSENPQITSASGQKYGWSSCMINSSPSYAFRYGYFEARIKLPSQKGFWPALWTWGAPGATGCVRNGETDAFEYFSDNHNNLYLTQQQADPRQSKTLTTDDLSADYHTFGADLEPTGTDFYLDGVNVYHASATQSCSANILVDMFVYQGIPPAAGTTEKTLVDYVRAWQH